MKVIRDLKNFTNSQKTVVTIGTFDGVHIGHQKILKQLVDTARKQKLSSVVLTFFPHPRMILQKEESIQMIDTLDEKIQWLEKLGVDILVVHPFTIAFSRTSAIAFARDILSEQLQCQRVIIGYDHRFGRNREGGLKEMIQFAETYNFKLEEIPPQDIEDSIVSSTKIRKALLDGDVHLAKEYLGDLYTISGKVEEGLQRGTTIGYPTANVRVGSSFKLIPKNGVYAVWVYIDKIRYTGMLNIGYNPTFEDKKWSMEVHILNFNKNIYHHTILISFHSRIRDEMKFENVTSLVNQLTKDEKKIRSILGI